MGKPKENNRHAIGNGNGKFGKKQKRIERMKERKKHAGNITR